MTTCWLCDRPITDNVAYPTDAGDLHVLCALTPLHAEPAPETNQGNEPERSNQEVGSPQMSRRELLDYRACLRGELTLLDAEVARLPEESPSLAGLARERSSLLDTLSVVEHDIGILDADRKARTKTRRRQARRARTGGVRRVLQGAEARDPEPSAEPSAEPSIQSSNQREITLLAGKGGAR